GLGFILRNSAGALGIYFAVILLLGSLIQSLGAVLNNEVMLDIPKILPTGLFETMVSNESAQVTTNGIGAGLLLNHSQSAIGLTIWAIVFLVVGGIMLKKKDA
ncbi:MAG: hypothetical protein LBM13_02150, partial [Candidatus Ancillula sp.]|nr:hypothetical protein [Candidatus Ancillula sp.]